MCIRDRVWRDDLSSISVAGGIGSNMESPLRGLASYKGGLASYKGGLASCKGGLASYKGGLTSYKGGLASYSVGALP